MINKTENQNSVVQNVQQSPSQVKGEGLKINSFDRQVLWWEILSRRGSQVQILPAAPTPKKYSFKFRNCITFYT